jgi:hypothetical protein
LFALDQTGANKLEKQYILAGMLRARLGGISAMTLYRWEKDPRLGFPTPLLIGSITT